MDLKIFFAGECWPALPQQLIIEHFKDTDILYWAKIENDADVRRFVDGKVLSFDESRKYVEMNIRQYLKTGYGR